MWRSGSPVSRAVRVHAWRADATRNKGQQTTLPLRACPPVPQQQSAKRLLSPAPPPGVASCRRTATPNGDSFSQINRIVKQIVRASQKNRLLWITCLDAGCGLNGSIVTTVNLPFVRRNDWKPDQRRNHYERKSDRPNGANLCHFNCKAHAKPLTFELTNPRGNIRLIVRLALMMPNRSSSLPATIEPAETTAPR